MTTLKIVPKRMGTLAVLLIPFALIRPVVAESPDSSDVSVSTPTPKKKSGMFKKLGSFVASQALGINIPAGQDEAAPAEPAADNAPSSGSPKGSAGREPTRSEIDQAMHQSYAAMGMDSTKSDQQNLELAKHTRIPKNAAEAAELDQLAREKGISGCMVWMHPVRKEDLATLSPKDRQMAEEYQRNLKEHPEKIKLQPNETPESAMWGCRGMVMETRYQLVKATGDPKQIKAFDAEYAEFGKQVDALKKNKSK